MGARTTAHRRRHAPGRRAVLGAVRAPGRSRRRRRGLDLIEFMFVLPFLLFFMLFTFDIGRVSLMSGILHDAANQAARAGAQAGGGCIDLAAGSAPTTCRESAAGAVSVRSFNEAMRGKPLIEPDQARVQVTSGGVCTSSPTSNHVVVTATYRAPMFAPGLPTLLGLARGEPWELSANAVARCEIVRR
jgi:Flp pilus assembly protein TadG